MHLSGLCLKEVCVSEATTVYCIGIAPISMSDLKSLPSTKPTDSDLRNLPALLIGGAVFNQQFNDNPEDLPVVDILKYGFEHGLNGIDTSPYYGPSEIILGEALKQLDVPRQDYFIVTKCGRLQLNDFDYSKEWIRKSVIRSLERLNTTYLDLVYLHDIEFETEDHIFIALSELRRLKDEGLLKNFGVSGYPVEFLYKIAKAAVDHPDIGPLDAVLSYSNFNLQNQTLGDYIEKFYDDCHLKKLLNASILSMSLLRAQPTHDFHPASKELRDKCQEVAKFTKKDYDVDLADLATRFAIREFMPHGHTVLGVSTLEELKAAIQQYWNILDKTIDDSEIIEKVKEKFGKHLNEVWESGITH